MPESQPDITYLARRLQVAEEALHETSLLNKLLSERLVEHGEHISDLQAIIDGQASRVANMETALFMLIEAMEEDVSEEIKSEDTPDQDYCVRALTLVERMREAMRADPLEFDDYDEDEHVAETGGGDGEWA